MGANQARGPRHIGVGRRATVAVGVFALGTSLIGACGSSNKTSSNASTARLPDNGFQFERNDPGDKWRVDRSDGAASTASGTPITIGVAMPDQGSLSLAPPNTDGLAAGLDYVNNVLGGVHGHPLKFVMCNSDETPALEVNCANNFVTKGVVAVFDAYDAGFAAESPILTRAGIPIYGVEAADAHDDDLATDYFFGPPNEAFAVGPLQVFHEAGDNKVQLTIANVPSAVDYVNESITPVAKKLGMNVHITYYDESSVNWQVVANSLISSSPQVTGIIAGPEGDCTSLLKALRTDGFRGPILMGSCSAYVKRIPRTRSTPTPTAPAGTELDLRRFAGGPDRSRRTTPHGQSRPPRHRCRGPVGRQQLLRAGRPPGHPAGRDGAVHDRVGPSRPGQGLQLPVVHGPRGDLQPPGVAGNSFLQQGPPLREGVPGDMYQTVEPGGFAALDPKLL